MPVKEWLAEDFHEYLKKQYAIVRSRNPRLEDLSFQQFQRELTRNLKDMNIQIVVQVEAQKKRRGKRYIRKDQMINKSNFLDII